MGDAVLSTLCSHVRHARSFQSAVYCPAFFVAAPIGAVLGPSRMDPDEEAGTAASVDHITERLQSLEAADQLHKVVVKIRSGVVHCVVGDPSNPPAWQTRCGFRYGSLPNVRYVDSSESPVDCGICLCRFVPRATFPLSSTSAGVKGGRYMGADVTAPVTHLAENKKKGRGVGG